MKTDLPSKKLPASFWSWIFLMVLIMFLAYSCFTFRSILQPTEGYTNSTFDVSIVCGNDGGWAIEGDASIYDFISIGVLLPDGWSVVDSIPFTVTGYAAQDSTPFVTGSFFTHRDSTSTMYEDSVGSDAGTYWWGAASLEDVQMDNLDSLYYSLTVKTDDKTGTFHLRYAIGYTDAVNDTVSDPYPITISEPSGVDKKLKEKILIYPNPASRYLFISCGDIMEGEITLTDNSGRIVLRKNITSQNESLNIEKLSPGIYFATVIADGNKWAEKIIIK